MKNTKVIAAFPACGKTYYFENREENNIVLDSDSSKFSWTYTNKDENGNEIRGVRKIRNPDFPDNYIEHIKENMGKVDYIFVSTHDVVRKALNKAGIDFILVYPKQSLKEEWIGRCFLRGSGEFFCQLIADKWDDWISEMERECVVNGHDSFRLRHGEYLSDAMKYI